MDETIWIKIGWYIITAANTCVAREVDRDPKYRRTLEDHGWRNFLQVRCGDPNHCLG